MVTVESIITPGDIARELNEPQHRIDHVLSTRRHIQPLGRVGIVRAYSREAITLVQAALNEIDQKRSGTHVSH